MIIKLTFVVANILMAAVLYFAVAASAAAQISYAYSIYHELDDKGLLKSDKAYELNYSIKDIMVNSKGIRSSGALLFNIASICFLANAIFAFIFWPKNK